MASRLFFELVSPIARPFAERLRRGRRWPTLLSALVGASVGFSVHRPIDETSFVLAITGGVCAALIVAMLFPAPDSRLGVNQGESGPSPAGRIIASWSSRTRVVDDWLCALTVLFENGVYSAGGSNPDWDPILEKLKEGVDPKVPHAIFVPINHLVRIETVRPDSLELFLCHSKDGNRSAKRRPQIFQTSNDRDEFLQAIAARLNKPVAWTQVPLPLNRAIAMPLWIILPVAGVFLAAALMSAYWIAHPPPPPVGKTELDPFVQFFRFVGPNWILAAGGVILFPLCIWLCRRVVYPPHVFTMPLTSADSVNRLM